MTKTKQERTNTKQVKIASEPEEAVYGECPECGADIAPAEIDDECWDCGAPPPNSNKGE